MKNVPGFRWIVFAHLLGFKSTVEPDEPALLWHAGKMQIRFSVTVWVGVFGSWDAHVAGSSMLSCSTILHFAYGIGCSATHIFEAILCDSCTPGYRRLSPNLALAIGLK